MRDPNVTYEKRPNGTLRVRTINNEPTMAQQQFAEECDINNVMKKYNYNMNAVPFSGGVFRDVSNIPDYHEMLNTVRYADEAFATLPADLRLRFANDPGQLIQFLQDPKNRQEAMELGLLDKTMSQNAPKNNDDLNDDKMKAKGTSKKIKSPAKNELDESLDS